MACYSPSSTRASNDIENFTRFQALFRIGLGLQAVHQALQYVQAREAANAPAILFRLVFHTLASDSRALTQGQHPQGWRLRCCRRHLQCILASSVSHGAGVRQRIIRLQKQENDVKEIRKARKRAKELRISHPKIGSSSGPEFSPIIGPNQRLS